MRDAFMPSVLSAFLHRGMVSACSARRVLVVVRAVSSVWLAACVACR